MAKKINQIAMNGNFDEIIVCELSPGDLDIAELIGFSHTRTISYEHMMSDLFYVNKGDLYIATRFHFRMLMENSGVRGIAIVIDDYYSNKHEVNAKNVNFHKNMSNVYSIETFISEDISLPTNGYKKNLPGRFFKKIEMYYLRFFCFV